MKTLRFLLVEDNDDHAELMKLAFGRSSVQAEVDRVASGEEALAYLRRQDSPRPDVVLLDVNLPGISGLDVLKQIKSSTDLRSLAVVIVSTSNASRDREEAYDNYVNSYVVKPMGFSELRELCEQLGAYWGSVNESPDRVDGRAT